jgi:acetylornithine deacetylase
MTIDINKITNLLQQIITIPSISGDEKLLADFLVSWFKKEGHLPERSDNNIWLSSTINEEYPVIMLNSHMDTVKPVDGWVMDPFIPEVVDGKIYGLGSNDAGGSLVSMIFTFLEIDQWKDRKFNLKLLISAEEENSGKNGITSVIDKIGKIDLAIVGEPTELNMAVCERGLLVLDCTAHGVAGHVAHQNGENAIYKALKDISKIKKIIFDRKSPFLGTVQAEVTQIEGGYQHNVVPDICRFVVDVRVNELYTNEEVVEIFKKELASDVVPRSLRLRSSFIDTSHSMVRKAAAMGINSFGSNTMSDQALIPAPSVKIGPGDSKRSHKADEFIFIDEIKAGIETYCQLLNNFE